MSEQKNAKAAQNTVHTFTKHSNNTKSPKPSDVVKLIKKEKKKDGE